MKKILFIAPQPFFEVRGTPIANKTMLEILSPKYKIDFLSYPFGKKIKMNNVSFYHSKSLGLNKVGIGFSFKKIILDICLYLKSRELIKKNKYDFIHANEESIIWASLLGKKRGLKVVYDMDSIMSEQLRNKNKLLLSKIEKKLEHFAIKKSDLILGVSDNFKSFCKSTKKDCNYITIWDIPQLGSKKPLAIEYEKLLDKKKKK